MSEAELQTAVIGMAKRLGWRCAHFRPGMTQTGRWVTAVQGDGKGFPDLICLRGERTLVIELKSDRGRMTPEQDAWLEAFKSAGAVVAVLTPRDWVNGVVEIVLRDEERQAA